MYYNGRTPQEEVGLTPLDPPPPALLPFQRLRLTAQFLPRRLWCQEDLRFKNLSPPGHRDPRRRGVPAKAPPPPPAPPLGGPLEGGGPSLVRCARVPLIGKEPRTLWPASVTQGCALTFLSVFSNDDGRRLSVAGFAEPTAVDAQAPQRNVSSGLHQQSLESHCCAVTGAF